MKIAYISEMGNRGQISRVGRDFDMMRTEWSWYAALKSTHHCITKIPELDDNKYDLGIVIIPKKHIAEFVYVLVASLKYSLLYC